MSALSSEARILELEPGDYGVIFNSLNDKRNELLAGGKTTDAVDEVILKVANSPTKKSRGRDEAR